MKFKHIAVILGVGLLIVIGCSKLTPAPEVKIVNVNPSAVAGDSATVVVTFRNWNKVDAIITTEQTIINGQNSSITNNPVSFNIYVPGNIDSITTTIAFTGLNALRTAVGTPASMTLRFWGTDAYGYNKQFSDSVKIGL